jgi:gamma-glutamylputrescine oxidase
VTTSYWLAEPAPPVPKRRLDRPPDVVVVGGGVTGCAAALTLADAGLHVRLHDAREIAGGASGRNGGFALRGCAAPYDVTAESIGRAQARRLWGLTEEALDRLEALGGRRSPDREPASGGR